jgi:chromosome partitioning protein
VALKSTDQIDNVLEHLQAAGQIKIVMIDTPGKMSEDLGPIIRASDLVIVPTRPGPHDLRALGPTVDAVEELAKPMVFVVNGAAPRARLTLQAAVALSQHGPVATTTVHQRVDLAAAMVDGRTAREAEGSPKAVEEIECLWKYVSTYLRRLNSKSKTKAAATHSRRPVSTQKRMHVSTSKEKA